MSRSTIAKSRAEKGGKSTNAPTPAVTHEIIPGKFNDQDWNLMVEHDEGDDFMLELVEEMVESAMSVIHHNYLQKQIIPFTVMQAKDALLQIIEWQFLSRDEGEENLESDQGWMQEEEPEPGVTDCWAQGSVPRQVTPRPTTVIPEEPLVIEDVEQEAHQKDDEDEVIEAEMEEVEDGGHKPASPTGPITTELDLNHITDDSSSKKRGKFKPYKGKIKSAGLGKLTESLDHTEMRICMDEFLDSPLNQSSVNPESLNMPNSCHSIVKLQAGRPPGNREVMYDDTGNVVHMTKINPGRLPSRRVRTKFVVVDPHVEAAQARLEAMRTGRHIKGGARPKVPDAKKPAIHTNESKLAQNQLQASNSTTTAPLLEFMEISAGVTVREGDRVKKGPKPMFHRSDLVAGTSHQTLKPVTIRANLPTFTVQELLERESPIIRPLQSTPPIPPIHKHMEMV